MAKTDFQYAKDGTVLIAERGKMRYYEREPLKTFEEFEKNILDLYDEIQATIERLEEEKGASQAEIMCVLGNVLAAAARSAGVSRESFLQTMEVSFLQGMPDEPPSLH